MSKQRFDRHTQSLRRYFVDTFFARAFLNVAPGSRVLDLGGHKSAKRGQFDINRFDVEVLYVNISAEKGVDLISDAANVAVAAAQFDVIICGEVLEHVRDPHPVIKEAYRLLKSEGVFLATVPFLFHIHADPHDFGRYTDYYWQETLTDVGFTALQIERQGLFYSVMANSLEQYLQQLHFPSPIRRVAQWFVTRFVINFLKRAAISIEKKPRIQSNPFQKSFTTGFGIYGVKV